MFDTLKRIFVGRPLATSEQEHQRLTKTVALAVFSSDAISSTAYATEEILFVTAVGTATSLQLGLDHLVPIAIGVALLIAIVVTSYRQTIYAYPKGGAAYVVSRENHGELPSLVAAASILVDYILTVAVSVSAGVAAIISIPQFHDAVAEHRVPVALVHHLVDQPGQPARHQGVGPDLRDPDVRLHRRRRRADHVRTDEELLRLVRRGRARCRSTRARRRCCTRPAATLGLFLILKGFSSGAVALTGIEAISDGVPAFRRPEPKNAARTLALMGTILATLFLGVSVLASRLHPYPSEDVTVFAQMGEQVFGDGASLWVLQILHRGHPDPRREHGLRRLPALVVDRRAGRIPPAAARDRAATGSCSRTASSCSRSWRAR